MIILFIGLFVFKIYIEDNNTTNNTDKQHNNIITIV